MSALEKLSVIIPVRPGDETWKSLIKDLTILPNSAEVFIVSPHISPELHRGWQEQLTAKIHFLSSALGRGHQLNAGASASSGDFLLFLHADSRLPRESFAALDLALKRSNSLALHYFDLNFLRDGPRLVVLNQYGALLRSNSFGIPFGDQGFCINRELFNRLGGYETELAYGEDHMFVWKCRASGVKTRRIRAPIFTSARKYRENGWLSTTVKHISITLRQILIARNRRRNAVVERAMNRCALAIFVKTPGYSPVKTRLARDIGNDVATAFYLTSVKAIEESVACAAKEFPELKPVWAVAETSALSDPLWKNFERVSQDAGDLGERLSSVYSALKLKFNSVILIGADSPQVQPSVFVDAAKLLLSSSKSRIVIGPAKDGGFFLFGSNATYEKNFWTSVPYSSAETLSELLKKIPTEIQLTMLPSLSDLDTKSDLESIRTELLENTEMTASQKLLLDSLGQYLAVE